MTDVRILVEHTEGVWCATAIDEVGTIAARVGPNRRAAVDRVKEAVREVTPAGEEPEFAVQDLA